MKAMGWTAVRARDPEGLTPRERQCVDLERGGASRKEIAARLGLSVITVAGRLWRADLLGARLRTPISTHRRKP